MSIRGFSASIFSLQTRDLLHQGGCSEPWCGFAGLMKRTAAVRGWITHRGLQANTSGAPVQPQRWQLLAFYCTSQAEVQKQQVISSLFGTQASFPETFLGSLDWRRCWKLLSLIALHINNHPQYSVQLPIQIKYLNAFPPGGKISPKTKMVIIFRPVMEPNFNSWGGCIIWEYFVDSKWLYLNKNLLHCDTKVYILWYICSWCSSNCFYHLLTSWQAFLNELLTIIQSWSCSVLQSILPAASFIFY